MNITLISSSFSQSIDSLILDEHKILNEILKTKRDTSELIMIYFVEHSSHVSKKLIYNVFYENTPFDLKENEYENTFIQKNFNNFIHYKEQVIKIKSIIDADLKKSYFSDKCEELKMKKGIGLCIKKGEKIYFLLHRYCSTNEFKELGSSKEGKVFIEIITLFPFF
jgi:hypothetical protein